MASSHSSVPSRVLVVDDNPEVVYVLTESLVSEGYAVQTAVNGREAIDLFAAARVRTRRALSTRARTRCRPDASRKAGARGVAPRHRRSAGAGAHVSARDPPAIFGRLAGMAGSRRCQGAAVGARPARPSC